MNWETEEHNFEFNTCGSSLESLDFLGDFIGSLNALYKKISEEHYYGEIPNVFKVRGGCMHTVIEGKK
tara:strand:- start:1311 stop:1514 length:204 start_codon:yes stop_codon:yes gene_type:complete